MLDMVMLKESQRKPCEDVSYAVSIIFTNIGSIKYRSERRMPDEMGLGM
jgi:hypothetical protein